MILTPVGRIAAGSAGLVALATSHFVAPAQSDLICLAALGSLILDGLSTRPIETRRAKRVAPRGVRGFGYVKTNRLKEATWAAAALLECESVTSVFVWENETIVRAGVLGNGTLGKVPIGYIPDLQAVPARVDFSFLPKNTQAALVVRNKGLVVLGCDTKRALSPKDIAWVDAVATRLFDCT